MTKEIQLTQGFVALVDDADFADLSRYRWSVNSKGYVGRNTTIGGRSGKQVYTSMHRYLMNAGPGQQIDHINRNKLDNRRENLRFATARQNMLNREKWGKNKFKGVFQGVRERQFNAAITTNGKHIYLGYFKTAIEAARAYDAAARQYHGEFARLNFPNEAV